MTTVEGGDERGEGAKGEIIKSKWTRTAFVLFFFFFFFLYRLALRGRYRCRFNPFPPGRWFTPGFSSCPCHRDANYFPLIRTGSELRNYCTIRTQFSPKIPGNDLSDTEQKKSPPPPWFLSRENKRGVILIITFGRIKTLIGDNRKILKDFFIIQLHTSLSKNYKLISKSP